MTDKLSELRGEIDRLDNEILAALQSRWRLSGEIIKAKNGQTAFRPGREADVVHRLIEALPNSDRDGIPNTVILGIWRQIFSASIAQQDANIEIAIVDPCLPAALWHFGSSMTLSPYNSAAAAVAAIGNSARYAMVPCDLADELAAILWDRDDLFVIARTPLFAVDAIAPSYIIGPHLPDQSNADEMLYAVKQPDGVVFRSHQKTGAKKTAAPTTGGDDTLGDNVGDNVKLIGMAALAQPRSK